MARRISSRTAKSRASATKELKETEFKRRASKRASKSRASKEGTSPKRKPKKQSSKRSGSHKGALLLLMFLIVLSVACYAGYKYVRVEEVSVFGNSAFTSEEIIELSGIQTGEHILTLDKKKIEENINSNTHLEFKDINVSFPNGIVIVVEERMSAATLNISGSWVVIDKNANVVEISEEKPAITEIIGVSVINYTMRGKLQADDAYDIEILAEVLELLERYSLLERTAQLDFSDVSDIVFRTNEGMTVDMGLPVDLNEKMAIAKSVMDTLAADGKTSGTIDVSTGEYGSYSPPKNETPVEEPEEEQPEEQPEEEPEEEPGEE